MMRLERARLFLAALLFFVCCNVAIAQTDVSRGKYLAAMGDCVVCHTAPGGRGAAFAGGYPLHATFGTVFSTNITPDKQTGIGSWTADQFYRAMHDGIAADGHHLYPAFPYVYFSRISRADSDAIYAYLHTVKPVHAVQRADRLVFPTNIRLGMAFWNMLYFDQSPVQRDPSKSAEWNRGSEIVNGLGHCGGCHTTKNYFFADKPGHFLEGEVADGWYAPNLTQSQRSGLGRWSVADIAQYLKTGSNRFGRVVGGMQDVVQESTSKMTDDDLKAIAVYLKSLPAAPEKPIEQPSAEVMRAGETVFVERCTVCHSPANARDYPPLAGNSTVLNSDPATLVRVIFHGAQSIADAKGRAGFSMPAFPVLSNVELADVATYIRNSWGNHAGAVSEKQAGEVRNLYSQ
jgi:mono/diheme cytochrome c family protein